MKKILDLFIVPIPLGKVLLRIAAQLIEFALMLIPSFVTKYIVDEMISREKSVPYFWIAIAVIIVFAIHLFIFYFIRYKSQVFSNELSFNYTALIGEKIGRSDMPSYEAQSKSKIYNLMNTDISSVYTMSNYLTSVPANLIKILVVFILLFNTNYVLALVALVLAPLYILSSYTNKNKLARLVNQEREAADTFMQDVEVMINNKTSISLHKAFPYLFKRFENSKDKFCHARNRQHFFLLITQELPRLITTLAPVLFLIIGSNFVINKSMTLGTLLFAMQLIGLVFQPLTDISVLHSDIMSQRPVFKRARDFMDLPDEKPVEHTAEAGGDAIRLKDITLFTPNNKELFHIENFEAQGPGLILIKGENGSGKSTLFNIFSGVFSHEQLKAGKDGVYQVPEKFQQHLGYLYYPDFIFTGTVADNIKYGRDISEKDFDAIHKCLNIPDADLIVRTKPENLSLGEHQKIYLARLLLGNFECLLLDEPNSNLDVATERNLLELISQEKKKRLILIISHDNLFDSAADKIYYIRDGVMKEPES